MSRGSRGKSKKGKQEKRAKRRAAKKASAKQSKTAERYTLYESAVQAPEDDVKFIKRAFKKQFGRAPQLLREDFCGTALLCSHWVRENKDNRAFGIDLDPDPLSWGRERHIAALSDDQAARVELHEADVMDAKVEPVDVTVAFNFSYFIFKERKQLLRYFERARQGLREEGVFLIDLYGGPEAQQTMEETREEEGFEYVWDQDKFDPINHHVINHIHFQFEDGSQIKKAFTYDWRLWTMPELRDLLEEAGFSKIVAYWEATDTETGEGNGVYYEATSADDDPAFVTYLAAVR